MRKYILLYILPISFVVLLMSITYATEKTPIKLRSSYKELSVAQVQSMPNMSIREKGFSLVYNHFILGCYGYSTISHSYDLKSFTVDIVL